MNPLGKIFNGFVKNGAIATFGMSCILLFNAGKLPSFTGPVVYGITAFGALKLLRFITRDLENCELDQKSLLEENQCRSGSIGEICQYRVEMKSQPAVPKTEDGIFSDEFADTAFYEKFYQERYRTLGFHYFENNAIRKDAYQLSKESMEQHKRMEVDSANLEEQEELEMLLHEISGKAENEENALLLHFEKVMEYFEGKMGHIIDEQHDSLENILNPDGNDKLNDDNKNILKFVEVVENRKEIDEVHPRNIEKQTIEIANKDIEREYTLENLQLGKNGEQDDVQYELRKNHNSRNMENQNTEIIDKQGKNIEITKKVHKEKESDREDLQLRENAQRVDDKICLPKNSERYG